MIRTPPEKRDHAAIEESKKKTTAAISILDGQLAKTAYVAGDGFSYGDIPAAVMANRYRQLVPERPPLRQFRALVRGNIRASGVQGTGRRRAAGVMIVTPGCADGANLE